MPSLGGDRERRVGVATSHVCQNRVYYPLNRESGILARTRSHYLYTSPRYHEASIPGSYIGRVARTSASRRVLPEPALNPQKRTAKLK